MNYTTTSTGDYEADSMPHTNYPARHAIDDTVCFIPMAHQLESMALEPESREGRIVAIKFTKAKVFYDILDDYYGKVFEGIDSIRVGKTESDIPLINQTK